MSFIRLKKINDKEYAYLVENKWYKRKAKGKNKGPRQKVSKYLGRSYSFDKVNDDDFFSFKKIDDLSKYLKKGKSGIIRDLVEWELFRQNICNDDFLVDLDNKIVKKGKKEVSLRINEGFLNSFTLDRLFRLRIGDSYHLAKCFIEAGIEVPKDVFVGMFGS